MAHAIAEKTEVEIGRVFAPLLASLAQKFLELGAPKLEQRNADQIAALPLGGRIHMDSWSDKIEMTKGNRVPLISPREKMSFEVTPVFPYVTRFGEGDKAKVTAAAAPQQ